VNRAARVLVHQREQGGGVDARAQIEADRHVAAHLQPDRILEQITVLRDQAPFGDGAAMARPPAPEPLHLDAARIRHEQVPGWELEDALEERVGRGHGAQGKQLGQPGQVHLARAVVGLEQRLDLGGEQ
jgi:hypothetical protein